MYSVPIKEMLYIEIGFEVIEGILMHRTVYTKL